MAIIFQSKAWSDTADSGTPITSEDMNRIETVCQTLVSTVNDIEKLASRKVLYNNSTGSNKTITLSETCSNYNVLEIYYKDNNKNANCFTRVNNPNNSNVHLSSIEQNASHEMFFRATDYNISGNKIVPKYFGIFKVSGNSIYEQQWNDNYIYITKVIGCYI